MLSNNAGSLSAATIGDGTRFTCKINEEHHVDVIYIGVLIVFFAATAGLIRLCERLLAGDKP